MNLRKMYTALLTADLAAAEGWYTKLLGRGPDYRPMHSLVFLYVDDLGAERRRLQGLGIALVGAGVKLTHLVG